MWHIVSHIVAPQTKRAPARAALRRHTPLTALCSSPAHAQVVKIVESINELAQIMKDLSVLVIDQGTIVDRIDYNIQTVRDRRCCCCAAPPVAA